jgi:hypothetical protein
VSMPRCSKEQNELIFRRKAHDVAFSVSVKDRYFVFPGHNTLSNILLINGIRMFTEFGKGGRPVRLIPERSARAPGGRQRYTGLLKLQSE